MAKQARNFLKSLYVTGAKPLKDAFWDWLDSFWHKDDTIPAANIDPAIIQAVNNAATTVQIQNLQGQIDDLGENGTGGGVSSWNDLTDKPDSDGIPEGSTNLYFTVSRVLATLLTGLNVPTDPQTAADAVISATDSIIAALGKIQGQINQRTKLNDFHTFTEDTESSIELILNTKLPGKADLDSNNKVLLSQLPDSILGQLKWAGTFAGDGTITGNSNFPTPPFTIGENPQDDSYIGCYWICTSDGSGYNTGDWAIYGGSDSDENPIWQKIDNTDAVMMVNGQTGIVTITKSGVGLGNVDNTADVDKPVSAPQQAALNGKLPIPDSNPATPAMCIVNPDGTTTIRGIPGTPLVKLSLNPPSQGSYTDGDMYYNTGENNIYTLAGGSWGNPVSPEPWQFYIDTSTSIPYYFNGVTLIALVTTLSDTKRNFPLSVSQGDTNVPIQFFQRVNTLTLTAGANVASFANFVLYKGSTAGATRASIAAIQTDIDALTEAECNAGYCIRFDINIVAGMDFATAELKSNAV